MRPHRARAIVSVLFVVAVGAIAASPVLPPYRPQPLLLRLHPTWFRVGKLLTSVGEGTTAENLDSAAASLRSLGPGAIPFLIERLSCEKSTANLVCRKALAEHGHAAVPRLCAALKHHHDARARGDCAMVLGDIGDPGTTAVLARCAARDRSAGPTAARSLGQMAAKDPAAVTAALPLFHSSNVHVRQEIVQSLATSEAVAAPELRVAFLESLSDTDPEVRSAAAMASANIAGRRAELEQPVLAALLEHMADTDPSMVCNASFALQNVVQATDDPMVTSRMVEYLSHPSPPVRRAAAQTMGKMKAPPPVGIAGLRRLLKDKDAGVRQEAAVALAHLGVPVDPALLTARLDDRDWGARAAIIALGELRSRGAPAVPRLIQLLQTAEAEEAAHALGMIGPAAAGAAPALIQYMRSQVTEYQGSDAMHLGGATAGEALCMLGPKAVPAISGSLGAKSLIVRSLLTEALAEIGPASLAGLRRALNSSDASAREAGAQGLALLGPRAALAVPDLRRRLDDAEAKTRYTAAYALGAIGPGAASAGPQLLRLLRAEKNPGCERVVLINALGHIHYAAAGPDLMKYLALSKEQAPFRSAAVDALGEMRYARAAGALKQLLTGQPPQTQLAAARALCRIGDMKAGVPVLVALLDEKDTICRVGAAEALAEVGATGKAAIPGLTRLTTASDPGTRAAAAATLLDLGQGKIAVPVLLACLDTNRTDARDAAARALGKARVKAAAPRLERFIREQGPISKSTRSARRALAQIRG